MSISSETKIVCICRGGQNRSVAARNILNKRFGCTKVLACGFEMNDRETVKLLCDWADRIIVVGSVHQWTDPGGPLDWLAQYGAKVKLLHVGPDRWGHWGNTELLEILYSKLTGVFACES